MSRDLASKGINPKNRGHVVSIKCHTEICRDILQPISLAPKHSRLTSLYPTKTSYCFFTGDCASLLRAATLARLRCLLDFCAIFCSRASCSSALITSASSLETLLPSITLNAGVAGTLTVAAAAAAAAAAAERRVTRGVDGMGADFLLLGVRGEVDGF